MGFFRRDPECPVCGWSPYEASEDTCPNPNCEKHWTRLLAEPARSSLREAARDMLRAHVKGT